VTEFTVSEAGEWIHSIGSDQAKADHDAMRIICGRCILEIDREKPPPERWVAMQILYHSAMHIATNHLSWLRRLNWYEPTYKGSE